MLETFTRDGITFRYPGNWAFDLEEDDTDWVATLQTPASALVVFTYRDGEEPAELGDETVEALREEYPELDAEVVVEKIAGQAAMGYDIDFLTLDTPVVAKVRAFETNTGALLAFWQVAEKDREHYEGLLDALVNSLAIS